MKNNKILINYIIIISIVLIGIVFDIITKTLTVGKSQTLISGVLSIFYTENTGAGWSMFSNSTIMLTIFSAIIICGLLVFNVFYKPKGKTYSVAMGLILAGAIGNLFDRIFLGYVRDFIKLDFINFPIFNIADICLTIGAILIVIWILFLSTKNNNLLKNN